MKFKILILVTIIAVGVVGYYAYNVSKNPASFQSPISDKLQTPPQTETKTTGKLISNKSKNYEDPSGFKFSYPEDFLITVIKKDDPDYYSSLKLESEKNGENITLDVTSTEYASLKEWVSKNKQLTGNSRDIKLAGLDAKIIQSKGNIIVIAIDLDTLITINAKFTEENSNYWKSVTDKIVSTFAFELPETTTNTGDLQPADSFEEDIVFEGEEVIE